MEVRQISKASSMASWAIPEPSGDFTEVGNDRTKLGGGISMALFD